MKRFILLLSTLFFTLSHKAETLRKINKAVDTDIVIPRDGDCLEGKSGDPMVEYHIFKSLTISKNATLTLCKDENEKQSGNLHIKVRDTFKIKKGGKIDLAAKGETLKGLPSWLTDTGLPRDKDSTNGSPGNPGGRGGAAVRGKLTRIGRGGDGSSGRKGGDGGAVMKNGTGGGGGGNGGSGSRGIADDAYTASGGGGAGGLGGSGGAGGKAGAGLYIEADTFINHGEILANGEDGKNGQEGINGDNGEYADNYHEYDASGGGGGRSSGAGGSRGHTRVYIGWWNDYASGGGGGGGAGGKGAGGGGGGGGFVLIKARVIKNKGTINASGGSGGQGGKPGSNGGPGEAEYENNGARHAEATGGSGGGGGGDGGQGGKGSDGPIQLVYSEKLIKGNLKGYSPPSLHKKESKKPIIGNLDYVQASQQNSKSSLTNPKPTWLNLNWIKNTGSNWFNITEVKVDKTSRYPINLFGINKASYSLKSLCSVDYETVYPKNETAYLQLLGKNLDGKNYFGSKVEKNGTFSFNPITKIGKLGEKPLYNNNSLSAFTLCDGINYIKVEAQTVGGATAQKKFLILVDQYAPCDDRRSHSCSMQFFENDEAAADYEKEVKLGSNTGKIKVKIKAFEAEGAGIENHSDSSDNTKSPENFRFFIAKQASNSKKSALHKVGNPKIPFNLANPESLNKNCNDIFNNNIWNAEGAIQPWIGAPSHYQINNNDGKMHINIDLDKEGTYWLFACLKDKAENWSLIVDPDIKNTSINWRGDPEGSLKDLSIFNPSNSAGNYNYPDDDKENVIPAYIPSLHKRIIIDKPTPDKECTISDPCIPESINPLPAFIQGKELLKDKNAKTKNHNIRIAYSPPHFTNSSTIKVGIKLPPDNSGISKLYYKIGSSSPTILEAYKNGIERDSNSLSLCHDIVNANNIYDKKRNRTFFGQLETKKKNKNEEGKEKKEKEKKNWLDFCFQVTPQADSKIYIWLEDGAGNISYQNGFASRKLFVDINPPTAPTNLKANPDHATTNLTPQFTWNSSKDAHGIAKYRICYWQSYANFTESHLHKRKQGHCPTSKDLHGRKASYVDMKASNQEKQSFTFTTSQKLHLGRWDFSVLAIDRPGNQSDFSSIYHHSISDGRSYLDFTFENDDYSQGGVSPRKSSTAHFTFKVKYTDLNNLAPQVKELWIDLDNSKTYSPKEKFDLWKQKEDGDHNDLFWDGEIYFYSLNLSYHRKRSGIYHYRFHFENKISTSVDGPLSGNPAADNILRLDSYDLNSFHGMLQVRNNVYRQGGKYPKILIKPPVHASRNVSIYIYTRRGELLRKLASNVPYKNLGRYLIWDTLDDFGRKVGIGIYYVVYFYDKSKEYKMVAIKR